MGFGIMTSRLRMILTLVLLVSVQLNTAARPSRRSSRAGRGRASQPLVITDDTRRFNKLEDLGGATESSVPPTPIFKQWLELETVPLAKSSVKLHGELVMECVAVGSPPPTIFWLKNNERIESVATFDSEELMNGVDTRNPLLFQTNRASGFAMSKVKSKLPLRCIRPEDEGKYTCVAENDGRELASTTVVVIEEDDRSLDWKPECEFRLPPQEFNGKKARRGTPAYIHSSETIHMEAIGNNIVLPCRTGGKPKPRLVWTNTEGQKVVFGKKFQLNSKGDLVIKNLSWNEMGEYNCSVENPYGSESAATFLYPLLVSPPPFTSLSQLLRYPLIQKSGVIRASSPNGLGAGSSQQQGFGFGTT